MLAGVFRRFVISLPVGEERPQVLPLTASSVQRLTESCPFIQCIGDLRCVIIASALLKMTFFKYGEHRAIALEDVEADILPHQ
jgi:hypothetical protein